MKKIYLFFLLILSSIGISAQTQRLSDLMPREDMRLKSNLLNTSKLNLSSATSSSCQIETLVLYSDYDASLVNILQSNLLETGKFSSVDMYNFDNDLSLSGTNLSNYDAILLFMNTGDEDFSNIKAVLQSYIDLGGGVVTTVASSILPSWNIGFDEPYQIIVPGNNYNLGSLSLGTVHVTNHEILEGIDAISEPSTFYQIGFTLNANAQRIADWSNGEFLVATREDVGANSARRAELNLFPFDTYLADANSYLLIANSLTWASQKCSCPDDIVADNDNDECGAVVNYNTPSASRATVTQIDNSGLTSGDEFPIGVTEQSYELDFGGGDKDTCSFTVTVEDDEDPVINIPADLVVYSDSSACGKEVSFSSAITFSEYFTDGEVSPHAQVWTDFRAKLLSSYDYTKLTLKGTYDQTGKTLTDPVKILQIANALREGNDITVVDGDNTWIVLNYSGAIFLAADGDVYCGSRYVVRPDFWGYAWGGVNSITCGGPSQQMTVQFDVESGGDEVFVQDNCSADLEQTTGLPSGSFFPIGTTTNTYVATDASGNQTTASFAVTVLDTIAPTLKAKSIEVFLDENGEYTLTNEDIMAMVDSVTDNCTSLEDLEIGAYPVDFSCVHVGKEPVAQVVAKDKSGNKAKKWVTIMVADTVVPVIATVEDIEVETELCDTAVAVDYPGIVVDDNCSVDLEQIAGLGADAMFPVGISTETWVATDVAGNADTLSFDIIVLAGNDLPTLDSIADLTTDEDEAVTVELTGISYGEDCEEQSLIVSAGTLDATLVDDIMVNYITGDSTGLLEIKLAPNMNGTTEITVTVRDEMGAETTQAFTLTVTPVNDAPFVISPIPDQTVHASHVLEIPVSSVVGVIFGDVDDDELEVDIMVEGTDSLPGWATMSGDTLVCEPMIADTGCVNMVVIATDTSGATASDTFEVCVDGYPTAIGDFAEESLEVQMYPNPTNGQVNIDISSGIHEVDLSVMDITGRVVLQKVYSASERIAFDMTGKVTGMYFVYMKIDGKSIVKKLILDNK